MALLHLCVCILVLSIAPTSHSGTLSAGMYTVMKHDVKVPHDFNTSTTTATLRLATTTPRPVHPPVGIMEGRVCGSMDIRNSVAELKRHLQGCKVVEGYVRISLIDHANESDYENVSFPELREITCHLILYRVRGLRNLGHLFPNLTVIRGNTLFEDYALVVYEMMHLQELGLWELTAILRGSVRIEKNPSLCYVNTVNWKAIIAGGGDFHIENNMDVKSCPSGCDIMKDCDKNMCWGSQQHLCHKIGHHRGCHVECLGGCSGPRADQCFVCRGVLNGKVCVSECPAGRYKYLGRSCITEAECRQLRIPHSGRILPPILSEYEKRTGWWPFNGTCIDHCPPGYEELFNGTVIQSCEPCQGRCSHECQGAEVSSIADAQRLRGCTTINGSLEIYIRGSGNHIVKELEESLSSIEEIQGYLKISRSFPLTSLNFLKKLRIIHGDILEADKYAFLVIENQNLQELWDWNFRPRNFTIAKGKISFHYNPKLCLKEIELLREIASLPNYTNYDVSRESNGDKVACHVIDLNTTVKVLSSRNVLIEWEPCVLEEVLVYVIYYIEAPEKNVTEHDGLDACSNKGWKIKDVSFDSGGNAYQFLPHLEPFTQYAFYVKTYTKSNAGGQTKIEYFRTLPDKPSVPKEIEAYANSSSSILMNWQPPEHPNGMLSYYLIFGDWLQDETYFIGERDYCNKPLIPEPDLSVLHGVAPDLRNVKQAESCCEKVEAEPIILIKDEDDYNILCNDKPHNRFEEYGEKDPCQNYFYSFIHDKSEIFDHYVESYNIDDSILGQKFPVFHHNTIFSAPKQISWAYLNKSVLNENGLYEKFVKQVEPNRTQILLNNLHHFAVYNIHLIACRETYDEDENVSLPLFNETRCSTAGLVTLRTRSLHTADTIENYTVVYNETDEGSVQLKWMEPKMPNGMILKYRIEWGRADGDSFHDECLTREQYLEAQGGFILRNLMPGNYSFRVRATSLAGDGPPTRMFLFHIKNTPPPARVESLIILLLLGIAILICFVMLFIMWRRKQSKKSVTIIASVNPDYMSAGEIYKEDHWELSGENLQLLKELGQGSFGTVHEAILYPKDIRCAVKMINESASIREKNEFLNEASMMKSFAGAHHVVKLLGVVSKGNCPLVVMELMARGDLKSYLRKCRDPPPDQPDLDHMLLMAAQIADGMAYLEAHKFVHRDLAARNCMVADDLSIKIGDFGMTRDIYETDYYRNGSKGLLPVRWMSPESLKDGVFTSQSDVWSLGVVLWEMATLAEQPYQGLTNEQVLHFVLGGGFLDRPPRCSDVFYQFMVSCWHRRPSRRPRFLQIVADIEAVRSLGAEFTKLSFYHSKEGQDLKANLDQQEDIEAADDSMFDETFTSCPPVCFYQLLEQNDSIGRALSGRSCDDGYVLPGDSASEDEAVSSPSKQNSTDGYVLPNNFPLPCYSGHTLPDISEESESLLPQPVPSLIVPQDGYVPLSGAPVPKHSLGIRNLNSHKDSCMPAVNVSGGNPSVDIFKLEFPQQTSRGSDPNRVPDDNYVPPDNLVFETSDTNKCVPLSSASANCVQETQYTSELEKSEVPQMDNFRCDQTDANFTIAEEGCVSPKVSTPKLPNGLVNGFVARPKENDSNLPFK